MKMNSTAMRLKAFLIFLLAVIVLAGCSGNDSTDEKTVQPGTPVTVVNPVRINMTENLTLNATTVFQKKEVVRATFTGFVQSVQKKIGDEVSPGDILFTMRTKESAAGGNLKTDLGNSEFGGTVELKSSTGGILSEIGFFKGDYVTEGEQLAEVVNPSSLAISLNVPYQYVSRIRTGTICKLILPDNTSLQARAEKIIPVIDPESQTQVLILQPLGKIQLPANMNLTADIPVSQARNVMAVPVAAVMTNETQDEFWLMKLADDSTAVRIDIKKGIESGGMVEITQPALKVSDRIISDGAYGLPDSAKVAAGK